MKTIKMSDYSFSRDGYGDLINVCKNYGVRNVVLIGGKRALLASSKKIREALLGSSVNVLGEFVYGVECTMTNVENLMNKEEVKNADVIFAIGGGKALDTCKVLSHRLSKRAFSFPTICSNCAAVTAISVVYKDDGGFSHYDLVPAPCHMFVDLDIIAKAPWEYLWAGIGDGLSKQVEVEFATRDIDLDHTAKMGLALSKSCQEPFLKYGKQAICDCKNNKVSRGIEEIAMDILVSTGYVSNLVNQPEYYYNSSIAHIFYNTSTLIKREGEYLHGEVVSFGVMVLHAYSNNDKGLAEICEFNKSIGLPICLDDLGLKLSDLDKMAEAAPNTTEWVSAKTHPLSKVKFIEAIKKADDFGKCRK